MLSDAYYTKNYACKAEELIAKFIKVDSYVYGQKYHCMHGDWQARLLKSKL